MRFRIKKQLKLLGTATLIYFAHPYLSVIGGLGVVFWFWPPTDYNFVYRPLLAAIDHRLLGEIFLAISFIALITIMRIGPKKCGLCLPRPELMTKQGALLYVFVNFISWSALSSLGLYFWNMSAKTGGSTYWLIALAYCIRACIVAAHLFKRKDDAPPLF